MHKINQVKTMHDATAQHVRQALGWTEQQYADFQFEQGYEYLKYWIGGEDVFGFKELPLNASFWAWWRNQWFKRDQEFLRATAGMSLNEKLRVYYRIHAADQIEYTPQSVIMHDTYARMIYQLTHESEVNA